jgi:hypothetical protein
MNTDHIQKMLNCAHDESFDNYELIQGKTIFKVVAKPRADGSIRDAAFIFSDGTEAQIGATSEGFLSFVCLTSKMSHGDDWHGTCPARPVTSIGIGSSALLGQFF